jgi:hypothetical protein
MPIPGRSFVCQAGRVLTRLLPHWLHRNRRPASGTATVSESWSTTTSALWPQSSQVAVTACTPFLRMLPSVIGGPVYFTPPCRPSGRELELLDRGEVRAELDVDRELQRRFR